MVALLSESYQGNITLEDSFICEVCIKYNRKIASTLFDP
jgi:hypothetical protein